MILPMWAGGGRSRKSRRFEIGEPALALNNVLHGLASLPVRVS